jgi:RNA polymerase sigma-70 factor (ECF subfamily)
MGRQEEIPIHLADTRPSPLQRAGDEERAGLVQQAIGRLPDHYRLPLVMVHAEGLGLDEVARVLGLPEGTVKSRLFRARAMLRQIIHRHYPGLEPEAAGEEAP